ncbi:hypothetical protein J2129_001556 [Methanofollis sp. W23]|nr:hypothetical protein [Methanofollis sp. W23]
MTYRGAGARGTARPLVEGRGLNFRKKARRSEGMVTPREFQDIQKRGLCKNLHLLCGGDVYHPPPHLFGRGRCPRTPGTTIGSGRLNR